MNPDAVVIGAGVMGCGIGLRLAQAGLRVTILERLIPGAEASSAAGGILGAQLEAEGPGPFFELCLKSRALYPALARELEEKSGVGIGYLKSGVLRVAPRGASTVALQKAVAWQTGLGLRAELLDGDAARVLEPELSKDVEAAVHFPDDHQVAPKALMRALQMAAAKAGAQFRTGYVRGIMSQGARATGVELDGETLPAGAVVVAAGSWSSLVQGAQVGGRALRPARGQMVQLQTRLPLMTSILASDEGYLVPRADGSVVAGSTMELVGYEKQVTAAGLQKILAMAIALCPALAQAPVQDSWAGLRPYTEDRLPILGRGPLEQLFLATGHFRNGILLLPITMAAISDLVLGRLPGADLTPFHYGRFPAA